MQNQILTAANVSLQAGAFKHVKKAFKHVTKAFKCVTKAFKHSRLTQACYKSNQVCVNCKCHQHRS
jgi:hypothetical protein